MTIIIGDCLVEMAKMETNSIDFIVTDPPYGLSFMGKEWDHGIPGVDFWKEAYRICKPGSMMAAFGGTRTFHRLTCAIEDAGWEIRDCCMWLYGSGFPKSHNKFGLDGYGTALKPAWEPIILAMKPCDGTFAQNAEKWGLAGINIDESRIPTSDTWKQQCQDIRNNGLLEKKGRLERFSESNPQGRWPANLILDEEAGQQLDMFTGILKSGSGDKHSKTQLGGYQGGFKPMTGVREYEGDHGGASRFFYCAKASSKERNKGLEGMPLKENCFGKESLQGMDHNSTAKNGIQQRLPKQNNHPTVKPISLMKYIIKLLAPPGSPILLDPFAGSGSTLIAAKELGIRAIGIELNEEYAEIAQKRIENWEVAI